jgi:hypothetical protein
MTRVLLGVDTEADNQWDASSREALAVRNVAELPRLQKLCDNYGVRPTYLLTYEVASEPESRTVLRDLAATGRCEIGTHHHPWTTPPLVNGHLYPLNLEPHHYHAQLQQLTEVVAEVTGERPVSYRAGRNGFAGWQVALLEKEGYLVDSSVDPFFNERKKGGPSFAGAPKDPYFLGSEDPCRPGSTKVLEIPITSQLNRRWPQWLQKTYADVTPAYQFRRVLRLAGVVRPIWLRPSYSKTKDMLWLAEKLVVKKTPVANIIFHSSELLPGGSPYNRTREDVEGFYESLEALLRRLAERGVEGRTFRELRDEWVSEDRP